VSPDCKPMRSLGYKHLAAHLLEGLALEEAIRMTQRDTRRFARKQKQMFASVGGFEPVSTLPEMLRCAERCFGAP